MKFITTLIWKKVLDYRKIGAEAEASESNSDMESASL